MLDKIGFRDHISNCESLPISLSNNSYKREVLLESFITSIWCGANQFLHTEITRSDKALGEIFGWGKTPAQDAYKRYFGKFTQSINGQASWTSLFYVNRKPLVRRGALDWVGANNSAKRSYFKKRIQESLKFTL